MIGKASHVSPFAKDVNTTKRIQGTSDNLPSNKRGKK